MKKLYTLVALLLFVSTISNAQISKGKDFWFGFLQNYYAQTGELRVYITSETGCTGVISSPKQAWSQTFTVTPGVSTLVIVPQNIGENVNNDLITNQALHVVTTECVSVFAHYYQAATSDAAVIFPTNSLGLDYVVTTWFNASVNNGSPEFLIAATEDNTTIDITPTTAAGGHSAGVTFSITIDSGEVYQLQSGNGDLTGTRVRGTNNKNFALFGGHVCANVIGCGYCDHLFDQLYPTPSWGSEFVTVPYFGRDYDVFRVISSQNGTQFRINGGAPITLNAGQFNEFQLSAVSYITSNLPISVMQYSTGTDCDANADPIGDPFMIALSPVTQNINSVTFNAFANTSPTFTYYTNIIAKTADLNTVTFDGAGIGGSFTTVPQNPTYSYAIRTITQGDHSISANQGIIAYVYGYGDYESYGYSAGVRVQVPILSVYDTSKAYCPDDTVFLSLNTPDTSRLVSLEWDLGDGSPHIKDSLSFWYIYRNYGQFPITIIYELESACKKDTLVIDTVKILGPEPELGGPFQFCFPQSLSLQASARIIPDTLFWSTPDTSFFTTNPNFVYTKFYDKDDTVYIRISSNICDGFDTAYIYVGSDSAAFSVNNACSGTPVTFTNNSKYAVGLAYNWLWDFGDGTTSNMQQPSHLYASGGTYQVKLVLTSPAGCSDSVTLPVTIYSKPIVDIVTPRVCNDSMFTPINNTTIANGTMTFAWNFGDGSPIDTAQYPVHEYAQSGGYNITLVASAGGGACRDSFTNPTNIIIGAEQQFSGVNVCLGQSTQFNDLTVNSSGSAILSYAWDFADGSTSTQQSPAHTYTTEGTYLVTLLLDYGSNCYDSIKHNVTVNAIPVADFTAPDLCNSGTTTPADATTITTGNYNLSWSFGDGTASVPGTTPSHTYAQSGNYNIQLIAVSDSACADTITKTIVVIRGTTISFTAPPVCEGEPTIFTDATTNPFNTPIVTYTWDFADGNTATQQNTTHTYATFGTYNVELKLDYGSNCYDSLTLPVTVNEHPIAAFTVADVCNDSVVAPVNTSSISAGTLSYNWTFGDGSAAVTSQTPTHTYQQSNTYTIQLITNGPTGCADTTANPVNVIIGTRINFTAPAVCEGVTTTFTDGTTNPYNTTINSYTWDFADGATASLQNTTHTYATFGTYNVELKLDYGNNCADSLTQAVTVNENPVAAYTVADVCNDSVVAPVNTSSISAGALSYNWTFGDGSAAVTNQTPTHTYQQSNTYTIQLITNGPTGCADTTTNPVNVIIGTRINFTAPPVCEGATTTFTDQTTNPYNTTINSYTWDFADGATASQQNTTHTYATFGTYNVELKLDYGNNCADSLTLPVTVNENPVAAFTVADVCNDSVVAPVNTSSISAGVLSYNWLFGDGSAIATNQTPTHAYQQTNTYTIQLITTATTGCTDTTTNPVNVIIGTRINFTVPPVCEGATTTFSDGTTNPYNTTINSYTWDFADGNTANQQNTTHTYATFGTYNVELKLDYGNNCADSLTQAVTVNENPVAAFTVADVCNDSVVAPVNTSSISAGALSYSWLFGDASAAVTSQNPSHAYQQSNTYTIQLITSGPTGCADTTTNPVNVIVGTIINFATTDLCEGAISVFNDQTTNPYQTTIVGYTWDFGDGATSTLQNTTHTYATAGNYVAELRLDYGSNCADSLSKPLSIKAKPVADFTSTTPCVGNELLVNDASTPAGTLVAWAWDLGDGTQATTQNGAHNYAAAGNYNAQLAVTTADGCKDTVQKQVTVLGFSQAQFTTLPVCYPTATQFTNTTDVTTYPVSNFSWAFGDGTGSSTQTDPSYGYQSTGTFTATLIANFANGCADTGTAQAIVYEIPTVTSSITDASCFGGNDGIIQLTPVDGLQPFTYSWSNLATTATISSLNMGTYDVTFTDAHTCTSTGSYAVNEPTQLLLDTAVVPVQCYGYTNASITVNASAGTPGYFFTWSNGDNGSVTSNLGAGTYSVTCSDSKGCSATTAVSLTDPPLYTLVLDSVADVYLGNSVTLNADAINGNPVSWLWSPADNLSCATCQTTEVTLYNNYVYRVESVDDKGCRASGSILINVIPKYTVFIPNVFTPNGDGSNDFFEIFGNKEAWKQFEVAVFDRLGEKVYESNDMNFKWDGTYRGKGLNPAVFVYVIKVVYLNNFTDKVYKGSLTLLR